MLRSMNPDPALILITAIVAIGTFALLLYAMYLGGGSAAIRGQLPMIAAMGMALVAVVILLPILSAVLGPGAVGVIAVALLVIVAILRRLSPDRPEGVGLRDALAIPEARRWLLHWAVFIALLMLGVTVVAIIRQ